MPNIRNIKYTNVYEGPSCLFQNLMTVVTISAVTAEKLQEFFMLKFAPVSKLVLLQ